MDDKKTLVTQGALSEEQLAQTTGGMQGENRPIAEIVCPKCGHLNIIYPTSADFCANCYAQIIFG